MKEYVCESGMRFGPFSLDALIKMEEIPQYKAIQQGAHMSEFIYYEEEKQRLISVEAKTTAPNPDSEAVKCERCYGDGSTFGDQDKQNMEM